MKAVGYYAPGSIDRPDSLVDMEMPAPTEARMTVQTRKTVKRSGRKRLMSMFLEMRLYLSLIMKQNANINSYHEGG